MNRDIYEEYLILCKYFDRYYEERGTSANDNS